MGEEKKQSASEFGPLVVEIVKQQSRFGRLIGIVENLSDKVSMLIDTVSDVIADCHKMNASIKLIEDEMRQRRGK